MSCSSAGRGYGCKLKIQIIYEHCLDRERKKWRETLERERDGKLKSFLLKALYGESSLVY